jgi:hypothetical protein
LDELRERVAARLSAHQVGVFSAGGPEGASAIPVRYRSRGLEVECELPRWADAVYGLEQDARALLIVAEPTAGPLRWLEYRGLADLIAAEGAEPYLTVRLRPRRVDLVDETRGWGARETLDC